MEKQLRRYENTLIILGFSVILFGLWSVLKVAMHYTLDNSEFMKTVHSLHENMNADTAAVISEKLIIILICLMAFFFITLIIGLRLFIGMSAIREGQGRLKGKGFLYLVISLVMLLMNVSSIYETIIHITDFSGSYNSIFDKISALVIDFTSMIALLELIISSIQVKIVRNKLKS